MDEIERAHMSAVLNFWHQIECFLPFDLEEIIDDTARQIRVLDPQDLRSAAAGEIWRAQSQDGKQIRQFDLYLGVFDKSELITLFDASKESDDVHVENEQRADLQGRSCFARLRFSPEGLLLLDSFLVSTVPWAIGIVREHGWDQLSEHRFKSDVQRLRDRLRNWLNEREEVEGSAERKREHPLNGPALLELGNLFYKWACFQPKDQPLAVLDVKLESLHGLKTTAQSKGAEIKEEKDSRNVLKPGASVTFGVDPENVALAQSGKEVPRGKEVPPSSAQELDDEDDDDTEAQETDILNSFYLRDLELVRQAIQGGEEMPTLAAYLKGGLQSSRVDLYKAAGADAVHEALQPCHLNQGRWLENPTNRMTLLQQFAINQSRLLLKDKGLFSINGPPGTGKTTLLRDLIADILVQRASALAEFACATDAFLPDKMSVTFPGENKDSKIAVLRPSIRGYEMVIASTNNAAVQNVSEDLPKRKSIDSLFESVEYLQPVAHKIAAEKKNGSFEPLKPGDVPWGLLAGVLGRKENLRKFRQRLSFINPPTEDQTELALEIGAKFLTIYDWIDRYKGPSFQEAKEAFLSKRREVISRIERLQRLAQLTSEFGGRSDNGLFLAAETKAVQGAAEMLRDNQVKTQLLRAELAESEKLLSQALEQERLIDRTAPHVFLRWIPLRQLQKHRMRKRENAEEQLRLFQVRKEKQQALRELSQEEIENEQRLKTAQDGLTEKRLYLGERKEEIRILQSEFPDVASLQTRGDLQSEEIQKKGLWYDERLNRTRSELFARALELHQSWLAEVGQKSVGFRSNIFGAMNVLAGDLPDKPEALSLLWQSLFMVVPVISTTFASVGRQFRGLGGGTLGWLFIDEGGQAVPQASVGALWRARRAVVVGDPLQIEPVFSVPTGLIERLASNQSETRSVFFWPHKSSVQRLADLANPYGAAVPVNGDQEEWIGSPLRVHRRCVDPMFSIANHIAYRGKMVFGLKDRTPSSAVTNFGKSAWIDLPGTATEGQMVPAQIEFCFELIQIAYEEQGRLPECYIITPFKKVRSALKSKFQQEELWRNLLGKPFPRGFPKELRDWCKKRIGTVHTFQGKEAAAVIFVLGADRQSEGSAYWAAKRPNLLNVAVTRAKQHLYIIGDHALYRKLPHFSYAAAKLDRVLPSDFQKRLTHSQE